MNYSLFKSYFIIFLCSAFGFFLQLTAHSKLLFNNPPKPNSVPTIDKPFNQYTWLVSHNAFSIDGNLANQNGKTIEEQLKLGTRGLMLDLYDYNDSVYLCHKTCLFKNYGTFEDEMNNTIIPFLKNNPEEVLTLFLEDHSSKENFKAALNSIPNLAKYSFNPQKWVGYSNWPTLNEMIQKNQRLIIISENELNSGYFETNSGEVHVAFGEELNVENYWSLGDTIMTHNYECVSRWSNVSLTEQKASPFYHGWDRLFVMNQFHGIPYTSHSTLDNSFLNLITREEEYCKPKTQKKANYIAVDNITYGQAREYVQWHNNGGAVFNAKFKSFTIPSSIILKTLNNNKLITYNINPKINIFSGALRGIPKGTRITLYTDASPDKSKDYAVINIIKDIGMNEFISIPNFENVNTSKYTIQNFGQEEIKKILLVEVSKG